MLHCWCKACMRRCRQQALRAITDPQGGTASSMWQHWPLWGRNLARAPHSCLSMAEGSCETSFPCCIDMLRCRCRCCRCCLCCIAASKFHPRTGQQGGWCQAGCSAAQPAGACGCGAAHVGAAGPCRPSGAADGGGQRTQGAGQAARRKGAGQCRCGYALVVDGAPHSRDRRAHTEGSIWYSLQRLLEQQLQRQPHRA